MTPDMDHIGAERKAMRKIVALSHFFDTPVHNTMCCARGVFGGVFIIVMKNVCITPQSSAA